MCELPPPPCPPKPVELAPDNDPPPPRPPKPEAMSPPPPPTIEEEEEEQVVQSELTSEAEEHQPNARYVFPAATSIQLQSCLYVLIQCRGHFSCAKRWRSWSCE